MHPADPTLVDALADRYRIGRLLGTGGMSTVYLADDLRHGRQVAVKVLKPELAAAVGAERFLAEIRTTAKLQHPHILPLFDSGEADGRLFYVMPYVRGESLRSRLERDGQLSVQESLEIAGDVAAALAASHALGIVHRDIKPENILLSDGEALVADFGIALPLTAGETARLTATGLSVGTPAYMSPEQILGDQPVDARSDVYALGALLHEMLTGSQPFTGTTAQAVIGQTLSSPPPAVRSVRTDVPEVVEASILRALAKEPADRFESARDFIAACTPAPATPVSPRVARRWVAVGAVVAVVVTSGLGLSLWRTQRVAQARSQIGEITQLAKQRSFTEAFALAEQVERVLPTDTTLARLMREVSDWISVASTPAGATVVLTRVPDDSMLATDSVTLGKTPVSRVRVARADYRLAARLPEHVTGERMVSSAWSRAEGTGDVEQLVEVALSLAHTDVQPVDMVAVPGGPYTAVSPDLPLGLTATLDAFLIDRFEVSNAQYLRFVQQDGYRNNAFWTAANRDGLSRASFADRTGLPAPRGWSNQLPPEREMDHPVVGVSWYEAAAYCAAQERRLPTLFEWEKAARDGRTSYIGVMMPWGVMTAAVQSQRRANFSGLGTVPVDAQPFAISPYGAYAMAGNVKEWLVNEVGEGFGVTGGSWQDPAYVYSGVGAQLGTNAQPTLGFRCARSVSASAGDQGAARLRADQPPPSYEPVSNADYAALLAFYRYDRRPANRRGVTRTETEDWVRERFWLDGVEGDSVLAYLYLPKGAAPPFQMLSYVASSSTFFYEKVSTQTESLNGPLIKHGRAVLAVVLAGMLERPDALDSRTPEPSSVQFRDNMVRHATELSLALDYLGTRDDIDTTRIGYVGNSFGAGSRLPFAAVDDRYKSVVLIGAGIDERSQPTLPEAANFNFAPHINAPKLVVNGRQDEEHPWLTRAQPLWELLREPRELVLLNGAGHLPPDELRIPPINAFLDRTMGSVRR